MHAAVAAIEYHLPEATLTNEELAARGAGWTAEKIESKTGILQRHVVAPTECVSDLALAAGRRLFERGACRPDDVDFLLLCTQSPDYPLPTTACLVQERLGLSRTAGALDFNLGCSGYVYGLGLAQGLIETGQARKILLITAEAYSRLIHPDDLTVRTLFGDAAAATLIEGREGGAPRLGPYVYGTDGRGAENLILRRGGLRGGPRRGDAGCGADDGTSSRKDDFLFMNGPEIFTFTLRTVPPLIDALLSRAGLTQDEVDLFVFHQANAYMLEHLRGKLRIPAERFWVSMRTCGNTVSSTIPIALAEAARHGRLRGGERVMLVGFGVGYSWGATMLRWESAGNVG